MTDSEIFGYANAYVNDATNVVLNAAVDLHGVRSFRCHGTAIYANAYGIATNQHTLSTPGSNIFLRSGSSVHENGVGIYVQDGGYFANGLDHGLVSMRCSALTNNGIGVMGEDVLLDIDAQYNVQGQTYNYTNSFQHVDQLFQICMFERENYYTTSPGNWLLNARQNYWGSANNDPVNEVPFQVTMAASNNYVCKDGINNVTLLVDPVAAGPVSDCPPASPGGGSGSGGGGTTTDDNPATPMPMQAPATQCVVEIEGEERMVHAQYQAAWLAYEADELELSKDLFAPIAALDEELILGAYAKTGEGQIATELHPDVSRNQCSHLQQVASVFVDPDTYTQDARLAPGATVHGVLDPLWVDAARSASVSGPAAITDDAPVQLAPNPAQAYVYLREQVPGPADYRCYDAVGRAVATGTFDEQTRVVTAGWPAGRYTVELRFADRTPVWRALVIARP